jgi:hypothetical protein
MLNFSSAQYKIHNGFTDFRFLNLFVGKHYLGDQITENEMGRAYSTYGEKRNTSRVLVGKAKGNRLLKLILNK